MDVLTFDLLSALLSNIEDDAIGQLSVTSKNMGNITNKLKDDAIFYKSRVENLLGYPIDSSYGLPAKLKFSYKGDWKEFYSILIKSDPSKSNWLSNALFSAAKNGNNLAIKVLLTDQRADPSIDDNSAIRKASENGHTEIVKLLLADPYPYILIVANQAASVDDHTYFEQLLVADKRVDPSSKNNKAIRMASKNGNIEVVKLLLADQRVDPSDPNNEAIRWASDGGHLEVVKLLLADQRVDPSDMNNDAIRMASKNGNTEVVKLLLADQRVDPSDQNNEAIRWASDGGHLEVVKLLLADQRVDPSDMNNDAIQAASFNGHLEIVKLLLGDQRVDLSAYNNSAIRLASNNDNLDTFKLLLGSDKINLSVKTQVLKDLQLKSFSKLTHDMNYDNIERLAKTPFKELIQIGNKNIQDRDIIITKYFWWLRLEILHNMTDIKEDPFKLALQLEQ